MFVDEELVRLLARFQMFDLASVEYSEYVSGPPELQKVSKDQRLLKCSPLNIDTRHGLRTINYLESRNVARMRQLYLKHRRCSQVYTQHGKLFFVVVMLALKFIKKAPLHDT